MHTQNPIIYNSCNWQDIKAGAELPPDPNVVSSLAFIIKAVHAVNGLALVIASEEVEIFREFNFIRKK